MSMLDDATGDTPPLRVTPPPAAPAAAAPKARDTKPRTTARKAKPGRPTTKAKTEGELRESLEKMFLAIGASMMMLGTSPALEADGQAIIERAEKMADALVKLAAQNPAVMRLLSSGVTGSAWLGVAGAFGGLGVQIAKNHGLFPGAAPQLGTDMGFDMDAAIAGMSPEVREQMESAATAMADQMASKLAGSNGSAGADAPS